MATKTKTPTSAQFEVLNAMLAPESVFMTSSYSAWVNGQNGRGEAEHLLGVRDATKKAMIENGWLEQDGVMIGRNRIVYKVSESGKRAYEAYIGSGASWDKALADRADEIAKKTASYNARQIETDVLYDEDDGITAKVYRKGEPDKYIAIGTRRPCFDADGQPRIDIILDGLGLMTISEVDCLGPLLAAASRVARDGAAHMLKARAKENETKVSENPLAADGFHNGEFGDHE